MLFSWLSRRREYRALVDAEATRLAEDEGGAGYYTARQLASAARSQGNPGAAKLWSCVARRVADMTGLQPGRSKIGRAESER
ncbi:hypothetical protein DK26_15240 [Bosea sp. WAO]|uniref:hypothetical protein n=1 Tax=Bosea sp. WAO TaxID=406341 RepID=UPI0007495EDF|nr:hypothetical protein [Bosea sp. WAO]KUL94359.1 hypothetical protein DK26_15240 [Bosea sp. WAO]